MRVADERGFTLIELLVVILIIGILAAIAIPSFLNQKGKASDASAKELAHTAQVAIETCATDNSGQYAANCGTATKLQGYEATIQVGSGIPGNAYLASATGVTAPATGQPGNSYTVTATSTTGDTFSITRTAAGALIRRCTPSTGPVGGCVNGSW